MNKTELYNKLNTLKTELIGIRHDVKNSDTILTKRDNIEFMVRLETMTNMDNEMMDYILEEDA